LCYVKNQNLGFTIPYSINNVEHQYYPDFLVRIDDGHGIDDPLNLILEVTGERKKEKEAKTATARTLWVPAVNNHGGFGRWAFLEVTDPYDNVAEMLRRAVRGSRSEIGLDAKEGTGEIVRR
jgi:type III restriction enzyme